MINVFNEYDVKIMSKDVYKNEYGEFEEHKNTIDKKINGSLLLYALREELSNDYIIDLDIDFTNGMLNFKIENFNSLTGESSVIYYFIKECKDGKSKKS